jgi:hypothetical protein
MALGFGPPSSTTADPRVARFKRKKSGIVITVDPMMSALLTQVIGELFEVIGPLPEPTEGAAWARDLGLAGVGDAPAASSPQDPVTARLFPDAYRDDDEAAQDFRRFTEEELRATKAAHAKRLLSSLPKEGGTLTLDEDDSAAWLGALNDARLALGTSLEITEDTSYELAVLEADEPRAVRLQVYLWLGELQESLLFALAGD